ncbi:MAG: DUF4956 domain-containing protein [Eubacteriales bacterium]
MLDFLFESIIEDKITPTGFFVCLGVSLVLGLCIALAYMYKNRYTRSFVVTLAIIPAVVALLIMLVSGNIGRAFGVAGAFSLIRFRSAQGSAREIGYIFVATGVGIAIGSGYAGLAAVFAVVLIAFSMVLSAVKFGEVKSTDRDLKLTIPESLDYTNVFDDIFEKYTSSVELIKVRTTNMGSLFRLHYRVRLRDAAKEKEFIDELRIRNGNLDIICSRTFAEADESML